MAIITPLDLRDHYRGMDTTSNDPIVARLITRADRLCARFCEFPLNASGAHTLESSSYELYPRPLPHQPRALSHGMPFVSAITTIHVDETWEYGAGSLIDHATDCVVDNEERAIWLNPSSTASWSYEARANKLVVTAGFVATPDGSGYSTAPGDIVALVATAVQYLWERGQLSGALTVAADGQSLGRPDDDLSVMLPRAVRDGLTPYIFGYRPVQRRAPYTTLGVRRG